MVKPIKKFVIMSELREITKEFMSDKKITRKGRFTFGKYKGEEIDEIIEVNPKYVLWAERNVSYFSLTPKQHRACITVIRGGRLSYFDRMEFRERTYSNDYDDIDEYSADYENDMRSCFDPNY